MIEAGLPVPEPRWTARTECISSDGRFESFRASCRWPSPHGLRDPGGRMGGEIHALALRTLTQKKPRAVLSPNENSITMAKIIITGGEVLDGEVQIQAPRTRSCRSCAPRCLRQLDLDRQRAAPARRDTTMELLGALGVPLMVDEKLTITSSPAATCRRSRPMNWSRRCAPRSWCLVLARQVRARRGIPARRLRHRLASGRPAHPRTAGARRRRVVENGYVKARCKRLKGGHYSFDMVTVTGTENVLMAAALAKGTTVLDNCARSRRSSTWPTA